MSLTQVIAGRLRTETTTKPHLKPIRKPGNPDTEFPMIKAAAAEIGIHRVTLYRVLKGQYPDRAGYADRYRAFVAANAKATA